MPTNLPSFTRLLISITALAVGAGAEALFANTYPLITLIALFLAAGVFVYFLRAQPGPRIQVTFFPASQAIPSRKNAGVELLRALRSMQLRQALPALRQLSADAAAWPGQNRYIAGAAALGLGFAGQLMLSSGEAIPGAILLGSGLVVFAAAFQAQPGLDVIPAEPAPGKTAAAPHPSLGRGALILAVVLALAAFWMFGTDYPAVIPWVLHLSSIALLVASAVWLNTSSAFTPPAKDGHDRGWPWLEGLILLAILALAIFLRFYRLDQLPFGTWYDEADDGLNALKILTQPGFLPVFVDSTALPAHYIYLIALFFRFLGVSTFAMRAVSASLGVATVGAAYFAGRELFDRRMGLVLAFFIAIARWDINWSRIAMHGVSVPFFELLAAGFLLRALRKQSLLDYCLAGVTLGLSLGFYPPLRLFPLVLVIFVGYLWLRSHSLLKNSWRGLAILALAVFIASVPVSQFILRQPDAFFGRMQVTSIFTGKTPAQAWAAVAETTRAHLLMFNIEGDRNGRHNLPGEPMLDPISGVLLVFGLGLSLWRIRQPGSLLIVAWFFLMLTPAIFSLDFEAPQSYRAIGVLPAVYMLALVPIQALWSDWESVVASARGSAAFAVPLVLFLAGAGLINYHIYFDRQSVSFDSWASFSTPETIIGKQMAQLGVQADDYVSVFYYASPTVTFLAPQVTNYHPLQTYDTLPILTSADKPVAFFIDTERKLFYEQAKQYYPNADFKEYTGPDGSLILYQVTLKPADIQASLGITASFYPNGDWSQKPVLVRKEAGINVDLKSGDPAQLPVGAAWQGILFVDTFGTYGLRLHAPQGAELSIDDHPLSLSASAIDSGAWETSLELARGSHKLSLKVLVKDAAHVDLLWLPPQRDTFVPIPGEQLMQPPISNNGLLGKYYQNGDWQEPPAFTQVDPFIHFYYQNQPLKRPYTVEWSGRINIPASGKYLFGLESIDESELFIDGASVVSAKTTNQYTEGGLALTPGMHTIRIRFADRTGYTHINLYWTPPNGQRESIPEDVLFLP